MNQYILMTVDVEDWFQVENFKPYIRFEDWPDCELRVAQNVRRILDMMDRQPQKPRATFFVLGWLAERLPGLVREISDRGHEVASHGYYHKLCTDESPEALKRDLLDSKKLLEEITGEPVCGYRAPSFSISNAVLEIIRSCGYIYDTSYNSFGLNRRYGKLDLSGTEKQGIALKIGENFRELPLSNLNIGGKIIPMSGGGYFRLYPFPLFREGIRAILERDGAYIFYMHPWEIDPDQPRVRAASGLSCFRHYLNLNKTLSRMEGIFKSFPNARFISCREYADMEKP